MTQHGQLQGSLAVDVSHVDELQFLIHYQQLQEEGGGLRIILAHKHVQSTAENNIESDTS